MLRLGYLHPPTLKNPATGRSDIGIERPTALARAIPSSRPQLPAPAVPHPAGVALASTDVLDNLARAAGLRQAGGELPSDSPPALALVPRVTCLAEEALDGWKNWQDKHLTARA